MSFHRTFADLRAFCELRNMPASYMDEFRAASIGETEDGLIFEGDETPSDTPSQVVRTIDEQAVLRAVCESNACEAYDEHRHCCKLCGCQNGRHAAWLAKLRVGDCPRKLWPVVSG